MEYNRLVQGLSGIARIADEVRTDPGMFSPTTGYSMEALRIILPVASSISVLSEDVIQEIMPPNIRKAEGFVELLKKFLQYLQVILACSSSSGGHCLMKIMASYTNASVSFEHQTSDQ